jgi:hypothetical protein
MLLILKYFCSCALIPVTLLNTHSLFHIHVIPLQEDFSCHMMLTTRFISVLLYLNPTSPTAFKRATEL